MAVIESTTIPEVREAGLILRDFQADERMRQEAWYREKQMHDEASQLGDAYDEGRAEERIALLTALVRDGDLTIERAAKRAGMSVAEFEAAMKAQEK